MSDPYLLANGVLANKLGITDQDELDRQEAFLVSLRQAILDDRHVHGPFTFETLKAIHRFLFQDLYDWAGEPRTTPLAKRPFDEPGSHPVAFAPPEQIEPRAARIFSALTRARFLKGLDASDFARAAADLFVALNNLHPFREGNGRAQRIFLRELAAEAGHDLGFDVVTKERMVAVSVAGAAGDREPAQRLFTEISNHERVRALRKALAYLKQSQSVPWNDLYVATTVSGQTYRGLLVGRAHPDFMMRVAAEPNDWIAVGAADDLPDDAKSGDDVTVTARKWR